jgi:DNA polymerase III subunit delta
LDYKEIITSLKQRQFKPVYFFHGDESYFIDALTDAVENSVLNESEKSFNQTIFYGKDVDAQTVADNARRYPMMSEFQVIILKEAQDMKTLVQLQSYVEKPLSSTVLCIAHKHKKLDMRTAFAKALNKQAVVFESKSLYENQVPDFIRNWLKDNKLQIETPALDLMIEYLGTDLGKVINELEKLKLNVKEGGSINAEHIEKFIGISREYNVFELQKALAQRNVLQANRIINYFTENPKDAPFVMLVGNLFNYFSKVYQLAFLSNMNPMEQVKTLGLRSEWFLNEYKMALKNYPRPHTERIINLLQEYDLKSKGVNADNVTEGSLMKELIFKILHV